MWKKVVCVLYASCCITTAYADNDDTGQTTEKVQVNAGSQDAIGNMLLQSISLIGIPYRWGGNNPEQGMDCSGFIHYVFKKSLGINLPRTAAQMATVGRRVNLDELEPGDLIFFTIHHRYIDHVGMYIGDNKFIQSPHTGDSIKVTELNSAWRSKITGAKRIVQEDESEDGATTVESFQDVNDEALPVRAGYSRRRVAKTRGSHSKQVTKHHKNNTTHGHTKTSKHAHKKKHG
jgi:hypothetical protein